MSTTQVVSSSPSTAVTQVSVRAGSPVSKVAQSAIRVGTQRQRPASLGGRFVNIFVSSPAKRLASAYQNRNRFIHKSAEKFIEATRGLMRSLAEKLDDSSRHLSATEKLLKNVLEQNRVLTKADLKDEEIQEIAEQIYADELSELPEAQQLAKQMHQIYMEMSSAERDQALKQLSPDKEDRENFLRDLRYFYAQQCLVNDQGQVDMTAFIDHFESHVQNGLNNDLGNEEEICDALLAAASLVKDGYKIMHDYLSALEQRAAKGEDQKIDLQDLKAKLKGFLEGKVKLRDLQYKGIHLSELQETGPLTREALLNASKMTQEKVRLKEELVWLEKRLQEYKLEKMDVASLEAYNLEQETRIDDLTAQTKRGERYKLHPEYTKLTNIGLALEKTRRIQEIDKLLEQYQDLDKLMENLEKPLAEKLEQKRIVLATVIGTMIAVTTHPVRVARLLDKLQNPSLSIENEKNYEYRIREFIKNMKIDESSIYERPLFKSLVEKMKDHLSRIFAEAASAPKTHAPAVSAAPARPSSPRERVAHGIRPLPNSGKNLCSQNAVFQMIMNDPDELYERSQTSDAVKQAILSYRDGSQLNLQSLFGTNGRQQDAAEMLSALLPDIITELPDDNTIPPLNRDQRQHILQVHRFIKEPNGSILKNTASLPMLNELEESRYQLISVVCHRGEESTSGHYVAYIRKGDQWYEVNDLDVIDVESPDDKTTGYLYYYKRV